jgi:hypothetical protein
MHASMLGLQMLCHEPWSRIVQYCVALFSTVVVSQLHPVVGRLNGMAGLISCCWLAGAMLVQHRAPNQVHVHDQSDAAVM